MNTPLFLGGLCKKKQSSKTLVCTCSRCEVVATNAGLWRNIFFNKHRLILFTSGCTRKHVLLRVTVFNSMEHQQIWKKRTNMDQVENGCNLGPATAAWKNMLFCQMIKPAHKKHHPVNICEHVVVFLRAMLTTNCFQDFGVCMQPVRSGCNKPGVVMIFFNKLNKHRLILVISGCCTWCLKLRCLES